MKRKGKLLRPHLQLKFFSLWMLTLLVQDLAADAAEKQAAQAAAVAVLRLACSLAPLTLVRGMWLLQCTQAAAAMKADLAKVAGLAVGKWEC